MHQTTRSGLPGLIALLSALLLIPACGGGGGGGGAAPATNLAPFFGCVKTVVTAGGPRILVCWGQATDDSDTSSALTYRVFLSATSGGHNFAAPVATSAAGASCMQLTNTDSALIAVGTEVFAAVRAVDSGGAVSDNEVECACTPVATSDIAYLDDGAAGPGTLGNPSDPFNTLQGAIDAVPAGGGAVLTGAGSYNALTSATAVGGVGTTLGIYGGFNSANFTAGVSAQTLLAGYSSTTNISQIDGAGLDPSGVVGQIGHLDIRNAGRRSYVSSFRFTDDEAGVLLGVEDANIVVSCCRFFDKDHADEFAIPNVPHAIRTQESAPVASQSLDVVGCYFDEVDQAIQVTGGIQRLYVSGNRGEDSRGFVKGDDATAPLMIPAGDNVFVCFDCNDLTRVDGNAFFLDWTPETVGSSGDLTYHMVRNSVTGANSQNSMAGFGEAFSGGTLTLLLDDNFLGPIDSNAQRYDFLTGAAPDGEFIRATTVNVTVRNTTFVHINSDGVFLQDADIGPMAAVTCVFEDCTMLQNDQEAFDLGTDNSGTQTYSQDGSTWATTVQRMNAFSVDGLLRWTQRAYRGGSSTVDMHNNIAEALTDEFFDGDVNGFGTPVTAMGDDTNTAAWRAHDNLHSSHTSSSTDFCDLDLSVASPTCQYQSLRNTSTPGDEVMRLNMHYENAANPVLDLRIEGCRIDSRDDDNAIDLDLNGPGTAGEAYIFICNNQFFTGRDTIEISCSSTVADMRGYTFIGYNHLAGFTEGDGIDSRYNGGWWSGVYARNLFRGGGDDSEVGIGVTVNSSAKGGDFLVRNNMLVGTGEGITQEGGQGGLQIINNTVTHTGEGPGDSPMGNDHGGFNSPCFVLNGMSHHNAFHDVPEETIAQYTSMEEPVGSAGMGSILGKPLFTYAGTILDPITYLALNTNSPTLNAGDPRTRFNDPDGTRNDMGAMGGPGAGALGYLSSKSAPCPFLVWAVDPVVDLYAGARLITGSTPVRVLFTQPVNASTANASNLSFTIGGSPVAGVYGTSGRWVTFTPSAPWTPGAQVTITVGTGVQATSGAALEFNHVRDFAVRAATPTAESEANDTAGTANALPGDRVQTVNGALGSDADRDFFSFAGNAGDRLQVSLFAHRVTPATTANFGIRLYAADGTTVLYQNSSGLELDDPMIDYTLRQSGTFFIEIFDEMSGAGAGPFPWEMEINRN